MNPDSSGHTPRFSGKTLTITYVVVPVLLLIYFFPIAIWFPLFVKIDFSKNTKYPRKFLDTIYFTRVNEGRFLPINRDRLIADRDYKKKSAGLKRIVLLGDSFAAGYGLSYPETLAQQLEKKLGPRLECVNAAFFGTDTEMQVEFFFMRAAALDPDIVIIRFREDDIMPVREKYYQEMTADIIRKWAPHWPIALKEFVFRYEVLANRAKFWGHYKRDPRRVTSENIVRHFDRLNEYAARKGIAVLLIGDKCIYENICRTAREAALSHGWVYFDPGKEADLAGQGMIIMGDGHPSSKANAVLARLVAARIVKMEIPGN